MKTNGCELEIFFIMDFEPINIKFRHSFPFTSFHSSGTTNHYEHRTNGNWRTSCQFTKRGIESMLRTTVLFLFFRWSQRFSNVVSLTPSKVMSFVKSTRASMAFVSRISCSTQLIEVIEHIGRLLDRGKQVDVIYLDR